jgi:hypothetical protein
MLKRFSEWWHSEPFTGVTILTDTENPIESEPGMFLRSIAYTWKCGYPVTWKQEIEVRGFIKDAFCTGDVGLYKKVASYKKSIVVCGISDFSDRRRFPGEMKYAGNGVVNIKFRAIPT